MHPMWQNPIQRTIRTAHLSVLIIVHNCRIQYNREQFWKSPLLPPDKHHSSDIVYQRRGDNRLHKSIWIQWIPIPFTVQSKFGTQEWTCDVFCDISLDQCIVSAQWGQNPDRNRKFFLPILEYSAEWLPYPLLLWFRHRWIKKCVAARRPRSTTVLFLNRPRCYRFPFPSKSCQKAIVLVVQWTVGLGQRMETCHSSSEFYLSSHYTCRPRPT